ncbi:MAG: hypothetical protein LZ169_03870 [Thaumarchaeota archaeon]|nr:hypothetical protein [Candidatus Wolframiiraptor allenii]
MEVGLGWQAFVAIKASGKARTTIHGFINPPWWDGLSYLTAFMAFYYPSVSGFTVVRYAILNTFKVKVINSSLDIACEKGR